MSGKKKVLICGGTGFIGRNLIESFSQEPKFELTLAAHDREIPTEIASQSGVRTLKGDLSDPSFVNEVVQGQDLIVQAAATTSGSNVIVNRPHTHVTDNAVMNSYLFRAAHEHGVGQVVFFSCTVMYQPQDKPVKEEDFSHQITDKYFGVGWTKVYLEKMAEFYSKIGSTKYTVIRHSNIYGPHDKYDLEKSHVFGATIAKVMTAENGKVVVWGEGTEERDLLYVDDLIRFVHLAIEKQEAPYELLNVGYGESIAIRDLVKKIIQISGRDLKIEYDRTKPTIPFKLAVNTEKAKQRLGWEPRVSLEEGIRRSLKWYEANCG